MNLNEIEANKKLKLRFAQGLVDGELEPYDLALSLAGQQPGVAVYIVQHWLKSAEIAEIVADLRQAKGEMAGLPGKPELAGLVWEKLNSKWIEDKDFTPMAKLYAELLGALQPQNVVVNDNSTTNIQNNNELKINSELDQIEASREYALIMGKRED